MPLHIAVAGKGGTGKTTFCALFTKALIAEGIKPILAVDADANANLDEALGIIRQGETVSKLISRTKELHSLPGGMSQESYVEYSLNASLAESHDVDLIVMGGPEGPGCYCYANNLLRKYLDNLSKGYKCIIMDNEAGMEHISRRTTSDLDHLFVISDCAARSVRSAGRINQLIEEIGTRVAHKWLIITRTDNNGISGLENEIAKTGLKLAGTIPDDPIIREFDIASRPVADVPEISTASRAVKQIIRNTLLK